MLKNKRVMNLKKFQSIDEVNDRDLIKAIFATQLHILRELERIERNISPENEMEPHHKTVKEMVDIVSPNLERINEYLGGKANWDEANS